MRERYCTAIHDSGLVHSSHAVGGQYGR